MLTPELQSKIIYGLRTDIFQNAHYISEKEILYPVGNVIALHDFSLQGHQKLIHLPNRVKVNVIAISPNKKFAAFCHYTDEKPSISIYNLATLKKKKTLGIPYEVTPETTCKFICASFTFDSKFLAAVINDPEQTMLFYNWEKGKVESSTKLGNLENVQVKFLACNPGDNGILAVAGSHIFKFLNASETVWRSYGFSKADNLLVTSITWLDSEKLLAGSTDGRILLLENGDLTKIFRTTDGEMLDLLVPRQKHQQENLSLKSEGDWEHQVKCLVSFPKGLAFSQRKGHVSVYEKTGPTLYTQKASLIVPRTFDSENDANGNLYEIRFIAISPSGEQILVSTGWNQLFHRTDIWEELETREKVATPKKLEILGQPLHHGRIGGLATCTWKPLIASFGSTDRSVRIWNTRDQTLLFVKRYDLEKLTCLSLHPSGLFALIGFSDKLRLVAVLLDDLSELASFPVSNCKLAAFSRGGHLIAVAQGIRILVYTSRDSHTRYQLKGHSREVQGISWSRDDTKLYSLGREGALYEWDVASGTRTAEVVLGPEVLVAYANTYCLAGDGRVIQLKETDVLHEFPIMEAVEEENAKFLETGSLRSSLFVAWESGLVSSVKMPLQEDAIKRIDYRLHSAGITQMIMTNDEETLVTAAEDGSLCFWKMMYPTTTLVTTELPERRLHVKQVLVDRKEVLAMKSKIVEQRARLTELDNESVFKMNQMSKRHESAMKETHVFYREALALLNQRVQELEENLRMQAQEARTAAEEIATRHERYVDELERNYKAKLLVEYNKYETLRHELDEAHREHKDKLEKLELEKSLQIEDLVNEYEARLEDLKDRLKARNDELLHETKVRDKLVALMEDDADRELVRTRTNCAEKLQAEKRLVLQMQGELGSLKENLSASQKESKLAKEEQEKLEKKANRLYLNIDNLERERAELRRELNEKDKSLEEYITSIKELEKSLDTSKQDKLLLERNFRELQQNLEPLEKRLQELQRRDAEITLENKNRTAREERMRMENRDLKEQLDVARKEISAASEKMEKMRRALQVTKNDLLDLTSLSHDARALKKAALNLHHLHNHDKLFEKHVNSESEAEGQKKRLEKLVASLQKKLEDVEKMNSDKARREAKKTLENQRILAEELSFLEEELKRQKKRSDDLEKRLLITNTTK